MGAKLLRGGSHGARLLHPARAGGGSSRRLTVARSASAAAAAARAESASGRKVTVEFRLPKKLEYGSSAYLVGNAKGLGEWDAHRSQSMTWTDGDVWQSFLEVEPGETLEYKYLVKQDGGDDDKWQSCGNQTLQVEEGFRCVVITDNWKGPEKGRDVAVERVEEGEQGSAAEGAEAQNRQEGDTVMQTDATQEEQQQQQQQKQQEEPVGEPPLVPVHFRVRRQLDFGHMMRMVGGCEQMGSWKLESGLQMEWTNGDLWRAKAYVLPGEMLEYKYVVVDSSGTYEEWQDGNNEQLLVQEGSASVQVKDSWQPDQNARHEPEWGPVTDKPPQELLQRLKEAAEAEKAAVAAEEAAAVAAVAAAAAEEAAAAAKAEEDAVKAAAAEEAAAAAVKAAAASDEAEAAAAAEEAGVKAAAAAASAEAAEGVAAPQVNGVAAPLNGAAVVESPEELQKRQEEQEQKKKQDQEQVFDIVTPSGRLMRNMTVKELKAELKDLGLRTVGRKAELVVRLSEFLSSQDEI